MQHCPMCRAELDAHALSACDSCPLQRFSGGCTLDLVPCNQCGYHALPAELLQQQPGVASSPAPTVPDSCGSEGGTVARPLTDLTAGTTARVARVECGDEGVNRRLLAYGLAPGARIEILQRTPAYIVRVYETELALATEVALGIGVTVAASAAQGF